MNVTERTYFWEKCRAISSGILDTSGSAFLLLIAVRYFQAGAFAKGILAAAVNFGLLLSPIVLTLTIRSRQKVTSAVSLLCDLAAFCFLIAALFPLLPIYISACALAIACGSSAVPLMTQVYQDNYPAGEHGKRFSTTFSIRVLSTTLFSFVGGYLLENNMHHFRFMLLIFAFAFGFSSFCLSRCPSSPTRDSTTRHPLAALRFLKQDSLFRRTLISWMLMGFGNLMVVPLRVEYLANPKYGLQLSAMMVAALVGIIPNLTRLMTSRIWGWCFDRVNFLTLRLVLSLCFIISMLAFFLVKDINALIIGAAIFGIAQAGGDIGWSLWVIKLAPPQKAAEYMSVHTFFTGIRGMIAPFLTFALVEIISPNYVAFLAAFIIVLGALLLLPELKRSQRFTPFTAN